MPRMLQTARKCPRPDTPQTAPPPKKRMTLDAPVPVAQEMQPEPVMKQPMDVLMQMQDLGKTVDKNYNQFKKEVDRIQKHGTRFMVTNEFAEKMKELCEKAGALNALIPESVNIHPIRKRIQLIIKNCPEVFTKDDFYVESTPIQLVGFKWFLEAKVEEKGFLGLFLHAEPPDGFNGDYRIEVDLSFSIWNSLAGKDLVVERIEQVYTDADNLFGYDYDLGCPEMAKLEDLLDPDKTFLTPEGDIETWVDFTIKSATLNHLT